MNGLITAVFLFEHSEFHRLGFIPSNFGFIFLRLNPFYLILFFLHQLGDSLSVPYESTTQLYVALSRNGAFLKVLFGMEGDN